MNAGDIDCESKRLDAIFCAAIELDGVDERGAYLDEACRGSAELRRQVDRLLRAHFGAGSFLRSVPEAPAGARAIEADRLETPGTDIGPYKLLEQIGEGGFGVVFMAEQTQPIKRRVALKVVKPGMDTRQVIARFEAERQALALMDHPNIARVLDAGTTGSGPGGEGEGPRAKGRDSLDPQPVTRGPSTGRPYFVMELVKGVPVTVYCDEHGLTPRERLELFVTVCQAVQHAHQKGVIHRDIKPSNVLVTLHDGQPVVKVIDFGIAKATSGQLTDQTLFTGFAQLVGTPLYMSPEQAALSGLDVDTRSDIYSLGVLLYELLTGTTPFDKARLHAAGYDEIRRIIREEDPPRPSARLSTLGMLASTVAQQRHTDLRRLMLSVRGDLDWIVMKCLEKDRTRRYETANGLALDVLRYLHDEPVRARPPSAADRLRKFARRNRTALAVGGLAVLFLVLLSAVSAVSALMLRARYKESQAHLARAQGAEERLTAQLWQSHIARARAIRASMGRGQRTEALHSLRAAVAIRPGPELRDEAIACLALVDLQFGDRWFAQPVDAGAADPGFVVFDPQLARFAHSDPAGNVAVYSADDGRTLVTLPRAADDPAWLRPVRFSRDGRLLAVSVLRGAAPRIDVWDIERLQPVLAGLIPATADPWGKLDFAVDDRRLALIEPAGAIGLYDLRAGDMIQRVSVPQLQTPSLAAFNGDSSRLAVFGAGKIGVIDVATGEVVQQLPAPGGCDFLAWHPHELDILASCRHVIDVWNVATGEHKVLRGHSAEIVEVQFSNGGDLLASRSWDGTVRLWDPWDGRELVRSEGAYTNCYLQFSPDDRQLAPAWDGRRFGSWNVQPPREFRSLPGMTGLSGGRYETYDVSPEGRWLAAGMGHGAQDGVALWDLPTLQRLGSWNAGGATFGTVFDPRGEGAFTTGDAGIRYWPMRADETDHSVLRIGPPESIGPPGRFHAAAINRNGDRLAVATQSGETIVITLPWSESSNYTRLAHAGVTVVAISPQGEYVATGGWHSNVVRIWDAGSGACIRELAGHARPEICFSPDGRWLAASTESDIRVYNVGDWECRYQQNISSQGGGIDFSPRGGVLAAVVDRGHIQLVDPVGTRVLATLESPGENGATDVLFSPDGTKLIVRSEQLRALQVWDLRLLRGKLATLGLDWGQPPYLPREPSELSAPLRVVVDPGDT